MFQPILIVAVFVVGYLSGKTDKDNLVKNVAKKTMSAGSKLSDSVKSTIQDTKEDIEDAAAELKEEKHKKAAAKAKSKSS